MERQREGEVKISPKRGRREREVRGECEVEGVWKTQGSMGGSEM